MKISFCTTCKDRLWQLKNTLPHNIKYISKEMEIIVLDYQSTDGLKEYLTTYFFKEIMEGKIKYYSLLAKPYNFSSAYAKNVCHKLAKGQVLMNLDCDQFIDHNTIHDLLELPDNCLYIPIITFKSTGQYGRLGYSKKLFYKIKGYDEKLKGLKGDDSYLRSSTRKLGIQHIVASTYYPCIENTEEQKYKNTNLERHIFPPDNYPYVWGEATVLDIKGNKIYT